MTPRMPVPRLLPMTIGVLALVLATKTAALVRSMTAGGPPAAVFATAWANAENKPAAKPETKPPETKPPVANESAARPAPGPAAEPAAPPLSDSEKAILLDLRERRRTLEDREQALSARESMLTAAAKKLAARVEELQGLQTRLERLDANQRQREDEAWRGLVKVYETMKPRDAAVIFNDLAMPVLLSVLDRMKETKTAAILAAMAPDKAREVTTELALARGKAAEAGGVAPPGPAKIPGSGT